MKQNIYKKTEYYLYNYNKIDDLIEEIKNVKKIHPLDEYLKEIGIKHHKIRTRTPRHNGKVERSHRNDNERFYTNFKFYSFKDLTKQLYY